MPFPHDLDSSPVDWAIDQPSAAKVFDEFGIDYSCPGKSLAGHCANAWGSTPSTFFDA